MMSQIGRFSHLNKTARSTMHALCELGRRAVFAEDERGRRGVMAIPTTKQIVKCLLNILSDKKIHALQEVEQKLASYFGLTDAEKAERTPGGKHKFHDRVIRALSILRTNGDVKKVSQGRFRLAAGKQNLRARPRSAKTTDSKQTVLGTARGVDFGNPDEAVEYYVDLMDRETKDDLLRRTRKCTPDAFERLVVRLLVAMGYGGSDQDAGKAIGKSHDGGIDGVIKQDELGLDNIYIQAKQWIKKVGRPEIQQFMGALDGKHASKGVLITTSDFTAEAKSERDRSTKSLVLINGEELAGHMLRHRMGVRSDGTYNINKTDLDFFDNI